MNHCSYRTQLLCSTITIRIMMGINVLPVSKVVNKVNTKKLV